MLTQVLVAMVALGAAPAVREEAAAPPYRDRPAVADRIRSVRPGHAAELDPAEMAGPGLDHWRDVHYRQGPGGRDHSVKMAYSPGRRTAFYCGANRTAPHRLNDAWEYHLGSNTWHLLAPPDGDDPAAVVGPDGSLASGAAGEKFVRNSVRLRDGRLLAPGGGPLAPLHTWDGLACNDASGLALWCAPGSGIRPDQLEAAYGAMAGLGAAQVRARLTPGLGDLWSFDPVARGWHRYACRGCAPRMAAGASLTWLPDRKRALCYCPGDRSLWLFDPAQGSWEQVPARGGDRPGAGLLSAYSPRDRRLLCLHGRETWVFDFEGGSWARLTTDARNRADSSTSVLGYDPAADRFVLYQSGAAADRVRSLSLSAGLWRTSTTEGTPEPPGVRPQGYFDPDHGVLVICHGLRVWVCRPEYRPRGQTGS
jgi:hypothetical protein